MSDQVSALANPGTAASLVAGPAVPLWSALHRDDGEAGAAWKAWRASVDIEHLTWPDMQILPVLNGPRLEAWLAGDPAAGILKGIVRWAWSEAQMRLAAVREAVDCLHTAGCDSVTVTGAMGTYLRSLGSTAIRPVLELRLMVPRGHLGRAAAALEAEGWEPRDRVPTGEWLDRMAQIFFSRNGMRLYLHWRLLEVEERHMLGCEREFLADPRAVLAIRKTFRVLSPGQALLEALAERPESVDALAWQADAALVLGAGEAVDWPGFSAMAARYQPDVFKRIPELRAMGFEVPDLRRSAAWAGVLPRGDSLAALLRSARDWARRVSGAVGKA